MSIEGVTIDSDDLYIPLQEQLFDLNEIFL